MIKSYWNEEWKEIDFPEGALRKKYAISNYGRVISYVEDMSDGVLVGGGCIKGYKTLPLRPLVSPLHITFTSLWQDYFLVNPKKDKSVSYIWIITRAIIT